MLTMTYCSPYFKMKQGNEHIHYYLTIFKLTFLNNTPQQAGLSSTQNFFVFVTQISILATSKSLHGHSETKSRDCSSTTWKLYKKNCEVRNETLANNWASPCNIMFSGDDELKSSLLSHTSGKSRASSVRLREARVKQELAKQKEGGSSHERKGFTKKAVRAQWINWTVENRQRGGKCEHWSCYVARGSQCPRNGPTNAQAIPAEVQ